MNGNLQQKVDVNYVSIPKYLRYKAISNHFVNLMDTLLKLKIV